MGSRNLFARWEQSSQRREAAQLVRPAGRRPNKGLVGFEDDLFGVLDVVGAGRGNLLNLFLGRFHGRVTRDQTLSHHHARRIVVFDFKMIVAVAQ
jgi:hypothetical protein